MGKGVRLMKNLFMVLISFFIIMSFCFTTNAADLLYDGYTNQIYEMGVCGGYLDGFDFRVYVVKEANGPEGSFKIQYMECTKDGIEYKWIILFAKYAEDEKGNEVWIAIKRSDDINEIEKVFKDAKENGWTIKNCGKCDSQL